MKMDNIKNFERYNYYVCRTRDDWMDNMHHIHNSCEFLFIEEGAAYYYIDGNSYYVQAGDILTIGAMQHHRRVIDKLPFQRYGLTIKPAYYKSLMLENDLLQVFKTPSAEYFNRHCKAIDPDMFGELVMLLKALKGEQLEHYPFRSHMERTLITQMMIMLFRIFGLKRDKTPISSTHAVMLEIKEYVTENYQERLELKTLSEKFFLHPATISKEFHKYCDQSLKKYINLVRISEAAKLLETTNDNIGIIAEKCGFESEGTFLRQFKSIMEILPTQYRKIVMEVYERNKKHK